jgi:hypothetical protein
MNELMPPARSSLPALPYGELVVPLLVGGAPKSVGCSSQVGDGIAVG